MVNILGAEIATPSFSFGGLNLPSLLIIGMPMIIIGVFMLIDADQRKNMLHDPIVTMDEDGISYQESERAKRRYLKWTDVQAIETEIKSWISTSYDTASTFYSDGTSGTTWIPRDRIVTARDIALKSRPHWKSLFIPESKLPVSFEEFYDLVVPHFWQER